MADKDRSEEIKRLCAFAGKADLADSFITNKTSLTDVLAKLEELKKTEDAAVAAAAAAKTAAASSEGKKDEKQPPDEKTIREQILAEHADIRAMCKLAGFPDKADDYIIARKSKSEVMAALAEAQKTQSETGANGKRKTQRQEPELNARHNSAREDANEGRVIDTSKIWDKFNSAGKKKTADARA